MKHLTKRVVIACRVLKPEIEWLRSGLSDAPQIYYLDQGLHMTPRKMTQVIQEHIDRFQNADEIILGYGLCSRGTVGLTSSTPLIIPRVHDCISFFLGSVKKYNRLVKERPGTFYLTPGWICENKDPLGIMEELYEPRMGRETAVWGMTEELKNYTHIVFINTGAADPHPLRKRAQENAAYFGKIYEEIPGDPQFFHQIVSGMYTEREFIVLNPGEKITLKLYFS